MNSVDSSGLPFQSLFDVVEILIADTVGVATHQVVPDLLPVRLSAAAADVVLPFQLLLTRGHELLI